MVRRTVTARNGFQADDLTSTARRHPTLSETTIEHARYRGPRGSRSKHHEPRGVVSLTPSYREVTKCLPEYCESPPWPTKRTHQFTRTSASKFRTASWKGNGGKCQNTLEAAAVLVLRGHTSSGNKDSTTPRGRNARTVRRNWKPREPPEWRMAA